MKLCKKLLLFTLVLLMSVIIVPITASAVDPMNTPSEPYRGSQYYAQLKSVTLTGDQRTDVVLVALSQLGYHEGDSDADMHGGSNGTRDFVEYNRLFGKVDNNQGNGVSYGYYWCCAFATWCIRQAGVSAAVVKTEISCTRLITWLRSNSTYHKRSSGYTPRTGDLIFFQSNNDAAEYTASHIGIVMYVDGDTVYTVEGNTDNSGAANLGDRVCVKNYKLSSTYIVGYGVPAYTTDKSVAVDFSKKIPGTYFITVTSSDLNVRSGPGTANDIIGSVSYGDKVTVSEVTANGWGRIRIGGRDGWIHLGYAQYMPTSRYTISFDINGGSPDVPTQPKADGRPATLTSATPERAGYNFVGWATTKNATTAEYLPGDAYNIDGDTTLYAVWSVGEFKISFYSGDVMLQSGFYPHGVLVTLPAAPTKDADNYYTYTFAGWDTDNDGKVDVAPDGRVTANDDIVCRAVFNKRFIDYTITFMGRGGTVISTATYHYGDLVKVPEVPSVIEGQYNYVFDGWEPELSANAKGNATYTALYKAEAARFTVKFVDGDGKIMSEAEYGYGDLVKVPEATPTKSPDLIYTYTFTDWDKPLGMVTESTTYTAQFKGEYIDYTVRFLGDDGRELEVLKCHYGDIPRPSADIDTAKAADDVYEYTFTGWDHEIVGVTGDTEYRAQYTSVKRVYTVTFFGDDGVVYKTAEYGYGDKIEIPAAPAKSGYEFTGWTPELNESTTVSGNMKFTATYKQSAEPSTTTPHTPDPGKTEGKGASVAIIVSAVLVFLVATAFMAFMIVRKAKIKK